jgi:predicted permease
MRRWRFLVVTEVALALVLLVGAGLLLQSFWRLLTVNPGFRTDRLLTLRIWLPQHRYGEGWRVAGFYREALRRIEQLPGVQAASVVNFLPLSRWGDQAKLTIPGHEEQATVQYRVVDAGYWRTMGIALEAGRLLEERDRGMVVVSQSMARRWWGSENPIGRRLKLEFPDTNTPWRPLSRPGWLEVAGVVGDVRDEGLDTAPLPLVYLPYWEHPSPLMILVARTAADAAGLEPAVRREIAAVDKDQAVSEVRTMEQVITESVAPRRLAVVLLGAFAGLALVLAAVGVYGVMSWVVERRRQEIGIRVALGARRGDVVWLVVRQSLRLAGLGIVIGLVGAWGVTRLLGGLLYGVGATDARTFVAVAVVLGAVAATAAWVPARRAAGVDPISALRHDR